MAVTTLVRNTMIVASSNRLKTAMQEWRNAQMRFIEARYAYDQRRFSNRLQEVELRMAYKNAQAAAKAAMDAYYQAVDIANKTTVISS